MTNTQALWNTITDNCARSHGVHRHDVDIITRKQPSEIIGHVLVYTGGKSRSRKCVLTERGYSFDEVISKLWDASSVAMEKRYQTHSWDIVKDDPEWSSADDSDSDDQSVASDSDSEDEGSVVIRPKDKGRAKAKTPAFPPNARPPPGLSNGTPNTTGLPMRGPPVPFPHHPAAMPPPAGGRPMNPPMPRGPMGHPPFSLPSPPHSQGSTRGPLPPHNNMPNVLVLIRVEFVDYGTYDIASMVLLNPVSINDTTRMHCEEILDQKPSVQRPYTLKLVLKAISKGTTRVAIQGQMGDYYSLVRSLPVEGVPVFEMEVTLDNDD